VDFFNDFMYNKEHCEAKLRVIKSPGQPIRLGRDFITILDSYMLS
jgi:hypothetical protein